MRTLICAVGFMLFLSLTVRAQNSPDCRTAIPVCADAPIMGFADGQGDIDDFDPDVIRQTGCLEKGSVSSANIENNTSWYVFRAGTGGQLGFDIEALPTNGTGTPTAEWDFIVYGPDPDCADISNGTAPVAACNYEVNSTNFTGVGVNPQNGQEGAPFVKGSQNTYDEWLDVEPGQVYYILINNFNTNFDGDPEPFMLSFTGSSVLADQNNALDCTLRDEFLGLDIVACEGDPNITLSAMNSPAGPDIQNVVWSVDYDDDGVVDNPDIHSGPTATEYIVTSPNSGRYFVNITTSFGEVVDDILITYYGMPNLLRVDQLNTNLSLDPNLNAVEILVDGDGSYEYAINDGAFQNEPIFDNVPSGVNTVIINDKYGCGTTEPIEFLVVGYPKFFTPNDDGVNDLWNVDGLETMIDPVVSIFDRYGKLLMRLNSNISGWDGSFNGRPLPSSDYWFRLDHSGEQSGILVATTTKSHFTLKR